ITATIAAPMLMPASASAGGWRVSHTVTVRVYDPYRHDYHYWDRREERAYRAYFAERHRSYLAYRHQQLAQRRAYFRWRHEREERLQPARCSSALALPATRRLRFDGVRQRQPVVARHVADLEVVAVGRRGVIALEGGHVDLVAGRRIDLRAKAA